MNASVLVSVCVCSEERRCGLVTLKSQKKTHNKSGLGIRSFQNNVPIFAFFSVLYKRTERYLRSFLFFIKEQNVLFGFISHTNIANLAKKRT